MNSGECSHHQGTYFHIILMSTGKTVAQTNFAKFLHTSLENTNKYLCFHKNKGKQ